MKKIWYIYKNGNNIGQATKMNLAFRHINNLLPKSIAKYWQSGEDYIKLIIDKDVYEAKREEIN